MKAVLFFLVALMLVPFTSCSTECGSKPAPAPVIGPTPVMIVPSPVETSFGMEHFGEPPQRRMTYRAASPCYEAPQYRAPRAEPCQPCPDDGGVSPAPDTGGGGEVDPFGGRRLPAPPPPPRQNQN